MKSGSLSSSKMESRAVGLEAPPSLALLHAIFLLAGLGTMLLGPILPLLTTQWHLRDSQSGLLLLAQFCGATLGGSTVSPKLGRDLLIGLGAAATGFVLFALAPAIPSACGALLLGGFGVGRIISAANIIAGARFTRHRAAALSRLNFSWSFGALLSPLLAAWLTPHLSLRSLLIGFGLCFLVAATVFRSQLGGARADLALPTPEAAGTQPMGTRFFLYFAALLFVYGGLETCISAWLTTYALRYGQTSLVLSEYTMVLLLCGLTAGRALSAWLLMRVRDRTLQRVALALSASLVAALAAAHRAGEIAILAVLLGVSLAPIFPATFALLMARHPPARQAGLVLAASGVGAALLSWSMGFASSRSGSLQIALALPVAAAVAMLLLSLLPPSAESPVAAA